MHPGARRVLSATLRRHASLQQRARDVLEPRGVDARYLKARGAVPAAILDTSRSKRSGLLVMGGYGRGTALELLLGSATQTVQRDTGVPVLVCQ